MDIYAISAESLEDLRAQLKATPNDFASVHINCDLDLEVLDAAFADRNIHGATSCLGAMTQRGAGTPASAFLIHDPTGAYGTAMRSFDGHSAKEAAKAATAEAQDRADRIGERPELVWVSSTPGLEEEVLAGIEAVVGEGVPIIGGSAADNLVQGNWFVFDGTASMGAGVIVSVLYPSCQVSFAYQNGYSPTEREGVVTSATGRVVHEIDDQPAGQIYSAWTQGGVSCDTEGDTPKAILSDATLWPIGRPITSVGEIPFYLLAHPATAHANGELELFASVAEGEKITLMSGTKQSLVDRAGRVAKLAADTGFIERKDIRGALMIYCGGCMLSVQDELENVVANMVEAVGDAPFLGAFTFGEQGPLVGSGNRHGNLMISCIVFG